MSLFSTFHPNNDPSLNLISVSRRSSISSWDDQTSPLEGYWEVLRSAVIIDCVLGYSSG